MSRWVPDGGSRPEWPEPEYGQGYSQEQGGQQTGYGRDSARQAPSEHDQYGRGGQHRQQGYEQQGYEQQGYEQQGYAATQGYGQQQPYGGQDYNRSRPDHRDPGYGYGDQSRYGEQRYGQPGYPGPEHQTPGYPAHANGGQYGGYDAGQTQAYGYEANGSGYPGPGATAGDNGQRGYPDGQMRGNMRHYTEDERYSAGPGYAGGGGYQGPGGGSFQPGQGPRQPGTPGQQGQPGTPGQPGRRGQGPAKPEKVRLRRTRKFFRRRSVRVISAILAVLFIWLMFSMGQAAFKNNGQGLAANLAEWARDHDLGFVVTFGEWLSYNPPKTGGTPGISFGVPKNERPPTGKAAKGKKGFVPDIPAALKPLAVGPALPGEGQWRVVENVKGYPAVLTTLLRDGGQYTSYSNGIASFDQRLVKFSLRPGTEDPGAAPNSTGNWGVPNYIPSGQYHGLLATFNGAFKLDSARGGFYLNGMYHGSLVNGAASVVYYKNGKIKVGQWGRDFSLSHSVVGVRQNLKLLVDHGQVASNVNSDVITNFGATLGGGYWVWRSGLGITKDGRIVYVYGQALDAQDLALLLQRAGAVEGMQLDINPSWMKFDIYTTHGNTAQPKAVPLLPFQQPSVYSYLTPSTRDFTAVYAR
jgi:hypothetical protein